MICLFSECNGIVDLLTKADLGITPNSDNFYTIGMEKGKLRISFNTPVKLSKVVLKLDKEGFLYVMAKAGFEDASGVAVVCIFKVTIYPSVVDTLL